MKIFVGLLILATVGISARAQDDAKVITELFASTEKIVKNSPFSADAVSESVQTLGDGNRIVHSSTSKLFRNSEGRFRREMANGSGGMLGSFYSFGPGITILDPVVGYKYLLDENLKTARQAVLKPMPDLKIANLEAEKAIMRLETELNRAASTAARAPITNVTPQYAPLVSGSLTTTVFGRVGSGTGIGAPSKYETRTEQLGMQNIEGVEAEGTRTTTTIPAGAVGNERPIETVYESWYSRDLQLVLMSKHSDPRSGEQTYRLTNILRSEPDPSLFKLPTGYKLMTEPAAVYRIDNMKVDLEKAVVRAAQSGGTAVKTKP